MKRWHSESNYSTQNACVFFSTHLDLQTEENNTILKCPPYDWNTKCYAVVIFQETWKKNISKSCQHVHNVPDHMFFALEALARVWPYFVLLWHGSGASHPWRVPWRVVPVPVLYRKSCMELLAMKKPLKSTTRERRKNQTVQPKTPKKATKNYGDSNPCYKRMCFYSRIERDECGMNVVYVLNKMGRRRPFTSKKKFMTYDINTNTSIYTDICIVVAV